MHWQLGNAVYVTLRLKSESNSHSECYARSMRLAVELVALQTLLLLVHVRHVKDQIRWNGYQSRIKMNVNTFHFRFGADPKQLAIWIVNSYIDSVIPLTNCSCSNAMLFPLSLLTISLGMAHGAPLSSSVCVRVCVFMHNQQNFRWLNESASYF